MEKINLHTLYQLGAQVNSVIHFDETISRRFEYVFASYELQIKLRTLMELFPTLAVCRTPSLKLQLACSDLVTWWNTNKEEDRLKANPEISTIFRCVEDQAKIFETILTAELQTLTTYHATQKGIYLTTDLIERAEYIFPPTILSKINRAVINEVRSSGRCLAFDNGTASAFHMMRAVESVMHSYYIQVCKPNPKPRKRLSNWGEYIKKLESSPKPKVQEIIALIQQIKDKHRNLIMHPDVVLTPDEAFTLFEISQSVIIAMADELPAVKRQ